MSSLQIVTIGSPITGATVRYTLSGAEPTASDPAVPSNGQVSIDFSSLLRVRAFLTGRVAGHIGRAEYLLQSAAPTITPSTGTYSSAQTVTLAVAGPQTAIRYTLDGSTPTTSSSLYSAPFVVSSGTVITAQSFPSNGWTPSAVTSATLSFNYGVLNPPTASPAAGVYQPSQSVALSALSGATIRYTTDGSDPTAVSNLYVSPLSFGAGVTTLKAKAFHPDWTTSATTTAAYTFDATAPTIRASTFPYAVGGWFSAPVTVSFTCIDANGIASCSSPMTVSQEGTTVVSGTATDMAGNTASVNVTVNIDTTPPHVALTNPTADLTTTAASIELTGTVSDAGSGVAVASCNGVAVSPVSGAVTCTVPLRPGRNAVVLVARDAAGNNVSAGVTVTRTGTATTLTVSPGTRTLLVDEIAGLSLSDDFGVSVAGATWAAADPSVVSLSTDDPPLVTALAAGSTTITATKNGLSTTAAVTVMSGTSLPDGTTRWNVPPTAGLEMTAPIYTHVVDETVPDLFTVETDPVTNEVTMRALDSTGAMHWLTTSPGPPLMGDSFGGILAGVTDSASDYTAFVRFAGPAAAQPWRYESPGEIGRPAQAPDGTIFAIESRPGLDSNGQPISDLVAVVIDGETGQRTSELSLPRDFVDFTADWEGQFVQGLGNCQSGRWESAPQATAPVVGSDGAAYFQFRRTTRVDHGYCVDTDIYSRADDHSVQLLKVSPQGVATWTMLYEFTGSTNPWWPETGQTVPDGLGGILATWKRYRTQPGQPLEQESTVSRFDQAGSRVDHALADDTSIALTASGGVVYVLPQGGGSINAIDIATWSTLMSAQVSGAPFMSVGDGNIPPQDAGVFTTDGAGTIQFVSRAAVVEQPHSIGLLQPVFLSATWYGRRTSGGFAAIAWSSADDASVFISPLGSRWFQGAVLALVFNANYNAVELTTSVSADDVFNNLIRTFTGVNASDQARVVVPGDIVSGIGQVLTFQLKPTYQQFFQGPFSVEVIRFDTQTHTIAVKTLPGHPIHGWRYWRVFTSGPGRLIVETGAFDTFANGAEGGLFFYLSMLQGGQLELWRQYLEFARSQISPSTAYDLSLIAGEWNYSRRIDIMTNVCGHPPLPNGFCQ